MDKILINNFPYLITDNINELPIGLAKDIEEVIPHNSDYRNTNADTVNCSREIIEKVINILCQVPFEVLEKVPDLTQVFTQFIHPLLSGIFSPTLEGVELNLKRYRIIDDIYENETIHPFAEACDLLTQGNSINTADYLMAVYLRKKKEQYTEAKAKARVEEMNLFSYDKFLYVLHKHNEAVDNVKKYHPSVFNGDGEGKGMNALISTVAEKGIFNQQGKTPLESARAVKVAQFFDYIESLN